MARQSASTKNQKGKTDAVKRSSASSPGKTQKSEGSRAKTPDTDQGSMLDERTRRDILGVIFAVLGIALFVTALIPSDALVTAQISRFLHRSFGFGAYVLPFFLLMIGGSFFVRFERKHSIARISIGLGMIFFTLLAFASLFTPDASLDANVVFELDQLDLRGGFLGAGIAWVGLTLFGQVVSSIILGGIAIAGISIVGFSFSRQIEKLMESRRMRREEDASLARPPGFVERASMAELASGQKNASRATARLRKNGARIDQQGDSLSSAATQLLDGTVTGKAETRAITRKLGKANKKNLSNSLSEEADKMPSKGKALTASASPHPQEGFILPGKSYLATSNVKSFGGAKEDELKETALCLQETLEDFSILAKVVGWVAGPTVTLFKIDMPSGVRVSRVVALEDDIALALAAPGVRIFAPIPDTNYVGIEVPNKTRKNVLLGDVISQAKEGPLQIAIGMDVEGQAIVSDLAKMPHLLIGGTTGSGKSVAINAMIMSILMRATPSEVRFIMIDPKRVEFTPYNGIPHLYVPVVTEPREAAGALSWGVAEMEKRLKIFSHAGARNIGQYNGKVQSGELGEDAEEIPYIVIIIDELADLMMNVGKEVEFSISRIAQLARAAGIHLIVATQRPSTNVVTGLIKANITNRIAFNVASGIDSRVVLDTPGAENLIGLGDLLFSRPELAKPQRIQGCFVSEDEINAVVAHLKEQGEPEYHSEILKTNLVTLGASSPSGAGDASDDDPLLWEAADIVVGSSLGSTSNLQRRLKVGYSRAGRIMDMLEEKGIVGSPNGSKPREVLVDELELETLKAFENQDNEELYPYAEE